MMQLSNRTIAISILFPVVLLTLLSAGLALNQLKSEMNITADILMTQVDHVTSIARNTTRLTAGMADKPCGGIRDKMTETGALTPYIRSTGLIRDNSLICSSVTGARKQNVSEIFGARVFVSTDDLRILTTTGTTNIPDHIAIIYFYKLGNGLTAFSVVDARYFTDMMNSLNEKNNSSLRLKFTDGPVISSEKKINLRPPVLRTDIYSDFSQAHLEVLTPLWSIWHYILRNMLLLAPLFLLLTLVLLYLRKYLQSGRISLANEIIQGMTNGEFFVHYQPICETTTGRCIGAEALMRWQRADGKTIPPAIFIRAAEEEGIIISLTRHLFCLIAIDTKNWHVLQPFHLSVNIAADHLKHKTFMADCLRLRNSLEQSFCLVLEITERSLVEDTYSASEKLNNLRKKGCQVAVDDFGTGYSSLGLLQSLQVDYLKIDKSFIDILESADTDTPVLDTIIALSKRLDLKTIAEGVSTPHQVNWLTEKGVTYIQGFSYAHPMTANDFCQWYKRHQKW
ncbi:cyclic diguanylate phosphodiesterase [Citrobacter sp. Ce006]|uniref:EAL domain-containing protein n=1 Tax=Citrobacter sp. Ce006 TaxID=2985039 RepID=UPI000B63FB78|nr:cyclic diguanylate phosphodiesterase [Citrobacter sp. Ce006]MDM3317442.1 cyclic diguanylate phosphodiesterase [Citrobacter sp. Ce006]OUE76626.1 hypothetical protein AZ013_001610 [Citrobacter freundii]